MNKLKYIEVNSHFIRENVANKEIQLCLFLIEKHPSFDKRAFKEPT